MTPSSDDSTRQGTPVEGSDPNSAGGHAALAGPSPLRVEFLCCGHVYHCPSDIPEHSGCPRCRPLFAISPQELGPGRRAVDDVVRGGVAETLERLVQTRQDEVALLAAALAAGIRSFRESSIPVVQAALEWLNTQFAIATTALLVTEFEQLRSQMEWAPGGALEACATLKHRITELIPDALTQRAVRGRQQLGKSLTDAISGLVAIERSLRTPTPMQLSSSLSSLADRLRSCEVSTKDLATFADVTQPLLAMPCDEQGSRFEAILVLNPRQVVRWLAPEHAATASLDSLAPYWAVTLYFDRDVLVKRRVWDIGHLRSVAVPPEEIVARLGTSGSVVTNFIAALADLERASGPAPAPAAERRRPARKRHPSAPAEDDDRVRNERALKRALRNLKEVLNRFDHERSLDYAEARADLGIEGFGGFIEAMPLPKSLPPQITFRRESADASSDAIDGCWQRALRDVFSEAGPARDGVRPSTVRQAKRYLAVRRRGLPLDHLPEHHAYELRLDLQRRLVLEAQLLAGWDVADLDRFWRVPAGTASAFRDFFFNVAAPEASRISQYLTAPPGDLRQTEHYLKKVALERGVERLRAAIGHLQRSRPELISPGGLRVPVEERQYIEAEFRWLLHRYPVPAQSEAMAELLKLYDRFLQSRTAVTAASRPGRSARSKTRPIADLSAPFSHASRSGDVPDAVESDSLQGLEMPLDVLITESGVEAIRTGFGG